MQLRQDVNRVVGSSDIVTVWDSRRIHAHRSNPFHNILVDAINIMGEGSRKAQGLAQVLTSVPKLQACPDHRLYLLAQDHAIIGILKVGHKKLFIRDGAAQMHEIEPLCVLDFYVHEAAQRSGYGKVLFEYMMLSENVLPHRLAYDRPSIKFRSFLDKHYKLKAYVEQSNNFVVFNVYFDPKYKCAGLSGDGAPVPASEPPQPTHPPLRDINNNHHHHHNNNNNNSVTMKPPQPLPPPPCSSSCVMSATTRQPRDRDCSPTRSGVSYNIITLQEDVSPMPNKASTMMGYGGGGGSASVGRRGYSTSSVDAAAGGSVGRGAPNSVFGGNSSATTAAAPVRGRRMVS
eukprot:PhM_4_TR7630/c1_g1_i1/m.2188/K19573/ATAT1, MEC17; alpha-tubulin N-acetyltransferase 1